VEAVIHVAGVVNAPDAAGFEAGNVTGTLELVEAALAAGVPRLIFVSSLAARQPNLSDYGASKARAEKIVSASGLDWTIIRPPAIYGPRDREMLDLFRAARWGIVPIPPQGRMSVIHVGDLADALLGVMPSSEDVTHCLFEVGDGRPDGWTTHAFARLVGEAVGRRIWAPHLSRAMLMQIAAIDRFFRRSKAKLTIDRVNYMTHPDWVANPRKAVPVSLWQPTVDTREGLAETARWYRAHSWL
jgi:nucleoside-diphosphate-sugar epimerase